MRTIYLDYNATTPLDAEVRAAMLPFLGEIFGNPSSVHHVGRKARAVLDDARDRLAKIWQSKPSEVVFTSGGTESSNMAIFGAARAAKEKGRHLITSTIEHHAVLNCFEYLEKKEGFEVAYLKVNAEGFLSPDDLEKALRPDTVLVSIMSANNETGSIQPVAELGTICRSRSVLFHTDAVQSFGKERFDNIHQFNADFVSVCAHKFHGPKGAGALFIRSPLHPEPMILGGAHENERRAGTENVAGIVGLVEASERFLKTPVFPEEPLRVLSEDLMAFAAGLPGVTVRSPSRNRLANTVAITVAGADSITLLAGLDLEGVCASSGSACSAGSLEPSHVMTALGVPAMEANALVRFSLGRETTEADIEDTKSILRSVINRVRGV